MVIGATNCIDILEKALLHPGRLERTIKFTLPYAEKKRKFLKFTQKKMKFQKTVSLSEIEKKAKVKMDQNSRKFVERQG